MHKIFKLKNGIRVVLVPRKDTEVVTIACGFGVGSRNERENEQGISHFLEHMIYKGAKRRRTVAEVVEFIDSLGGEHNAFTSKEHTGYYVKLASRHFEKGLDFLSDNLVNATLPQDEVNREKRVIVEEIKMYEDVPSDKALEMFENSIFSGSELSKDVIGTKECVESITKSNLANYKADNYTSDNMVCVIAGKTGRKEGDVNKLVENYFNDLPASKSKSARGLVKNYKNVLVKNKDTEQINMVLGFKGPSIDDEEKYEFQMMAKILGGSMSSRLFKRIREELGLVYRISTSTDLYSDIGAIETQTGLAPNQFEKALEAILAEHKKIAESGVEKKELDRAKEMICGQILINIEDSSNLAFDYLTSLLGFGKIEMPSEKIKKYQAVTKEDVNKVAKKYLTGKVYASVVGPEIKKGKINKLISKYWKE